MEGGRGAPKPPRLYRPGIARRAHSHGLRELHRLVMKEFTPAPDPPSIVSVTDRVKPVALGMGVTSAHFLGDRAAFVGGEESVAFVDAKGEISKVAVHSGGILSTASDGKRL